MKKLKIIGLKLFKTLIKKNETKKLELEVEGRVSLEQSKIKIPEFDITKETFEELGFKYVKTKPRKPKNKKKGNGDEVKQPSRIARVEEKLDKFIESMNKFVKEQVKFNATVSEFMKEQSKFNATVSEFMKEQSKFNKTQYKFNASFEKRLDTIEKDLTLIKSLPTIKKEIAEQ